MPVEEVRELLPARTSLLMRLFPAFHRVEAIASTPATEREIGEPHELRRRMFIALRELLAEIARKRHVIITIDDLQWADADSFVLLREILRGVRAPLVVVFATVRGEDTAIETALRDLPVERTRLGPLNDNECRTLAESIVPGASARFDLERVSREAGGHPMFLQEILRHLALTGGGEAGATLDDALSARTSLLRTEARTLLEIVCIAGAPISFETAAEASKLDATTMARAVASLRVATLIRETQRGRRLALEPFHDRVRETVDRRIDEATRRYLHARIAHALETTHEPRDPQLLLRNFLLAGMPERAVGYAEDAAQRSEAAHAFEQAAELWRTALEAIPRDPNDRRRVLLRLGQALVNAGRGAEAAQQFLDAAVGADRATRLECHRDAAEQLMISGHITPGIAALEALLTEIGVKFPKTRRQILLSLLWHRAQLRVRGLGFRPRERREIAEASLLELEVLKIAGHSLGVVDVIRGMEFQTRYLHMALRSGHSEDIVRALLIEAGFLAVSSKQARAEQYITRALELGANPDDPYVKGTMAGMRGVAMYMRGDIVGAVAVLEEAWMGLQVAHGHNWENSTARLMQLFTLRFIGDFHVLRAKYEEHLTDAAYRGDRYLESTMRRACAPLWLAEDNVDGAVHELENATWVPPEGLFHVQHFHELVAWAEIGLYCGTLDPRARLDERFAGLHGSMLLRVESIRVQTDYLRARLAIAGHLPAREAARAARRLDRENNPLAAVWALLIRAGDRAGTDASRAAALFEQVAESAEKAGMLSTAAVARARVGTLRDDKAMQKRAEDELVKLGVRDPARTCTLLAPMRIPA
jgi:tetratricopeptide (TPR) repeat protein